MQRSQPAATINSKLDNGLHVVFAPGVYTLEQSITVRNANTILFGMGLATLNCPPAAPCISIGNVDGVQVSGLLLQPGRNPSPTLLQYGDGNVRGGDKTRPGVLSDVWARVGGPNDPKDYQQVADVMMTINYDNVIVDGTWLWRADHDVTGLVYNQQNPCKTGFQVPLMYSILESLSSQSASTACGEGERERERERERMREVDRLLNISYGVCFVLIKRVSSFTRLMATM